MPELTNEHLAEIEARAAKATGETWELREVAHEATPWSKRRVYRVEIIAPQYAYGKRTHVRDIARIVDYCDWTDHPANADFIAHARTDIPDLIAALRRLQAENERLRYGAAEAYQVAGNSDYVVGYMDNFLALAEGDPLPHEWKALMGQDHAAKKAARLTPEDYETILGALDGEISEEAAAAERFAPGSPRNKRHLRRVEEARAVQAKIEAARDGGEG